MDDQIKERQCRALWAKVLLEAYEDLKTQRKIKTLRTFNDRQEIQNWIMSNKIEIGSFLWICQALGLNTNRIRQKMLMERRN